MQAIPTARPGYGRSIRNSPSGLGKTRLQNGVLSASPPKVVFRHDFPDEWRFVVVIPAQKEGLSGEQEKDAIGFVNPSQKLSEEICRLVLMKFLPSLIEKDIRGFGHAYQKLITKQGCFLCRYRVEFTVKNPHIK